ncbi:hypothetical protein BDB00DRAFT_313342 [Zychaea mexicana]|uniref:uncharacterized protein n=1 Tax=Zychaea mexicana TaxID=64656 RepID=UPI0022FED7D5|nr:uncharacterized protein BDB00DRAFT_313342 [Zychaea mexicana]KAI9494367.1 hypothetical protein BDB00DRAFT_313342 [Zychaea mexicana]
MSTSSTTPMGADALLSAITLTHPYLLQQDQLSQLLDLSNAASTATTTVDNTTGNNFMIDDWLADELQHSGILTQQQQDLCSISPSSSVATTPSSDVSTPTSSLLPQSPPLTASPGKECAGIVNQQQNHSSSISSSPGVPLFPDIWPVVKQQLPVAMRPVAPAPPVGQPQQSQQQQRRPVPIMPKTTEMTMSSSSSSSPGATPATPTSSSTIQVAGSKRKASCSLSDKEQDDIAVKRQRNTDAARRSRLKKLMKMEALEQRVTELEGENSRLTTRVAVLESEKSGLESKDKDLQERVRVLEEQLAEAHKALTAKCTH